MLPLRAGDAGGRLVYVHGAASAYRAPPGALPVPAANHEGG